MTPERWERVKTLYDAARARPHRERSTFLARECDGDTDLQLEVEALLDQPLGTADFASRSGESPTVAHVPKYVGPRLVEAARFITVSKLRGDVAEMIRAPGESGTVVDLGKHCGGFVQKPTCLVMAPEPEERSSTATEVAAGAPLLVDVEFGRGRTLYALSQGVFPGGPPASPALPNRGALVAVNGDGTFTAIVEELNQPTSVEFIGNSAYVVTLAGEIWKIDDVAAPPHGASR